MGEQDFSRNRKQPFTSTLLLMLNFLRKSLPIEIDGFVNYLRKGLAHVKNTSFTSSAFIQNRKKINPGVFKHLSGVTLIISTPKRMMASNFGMVSGYLLLMVPGSHSPTPMN
jgi:hypothetical protein